MGNVATGLSALTSVAGGIAGMQSEEMKKQQAKNQMIAEDINTLQQNTEEMEALARAMAANNAAAAAYGMSSSTGSLRRAEETAMMDIYSGATSRKFASDIKKLSLKSSVSGAGLRGGLSLASGMARAGNLFFAKP
jgi:hypothetical protein